jgi:phage shock protein C
MAWTDSDSKRHRLWRDRDRGIIAGVCAGIADYFDIEPIWVRLAAVLCLVFFFPLTLVAYVVLAIVLRRKPPALYASPDEEAFWRGVGITPADTLQSLKRKFADFEARLDQMEAEVASGDFELHRRFRDLGR